MNSLDQDGKLPSRNSGLYLFFFSRFFFWSTSVAKERVTVKVLALQPPVCLRALFIRSFSVVGTKGLVKAGVQLLKVINVLIFVSLWLEHNCVSSQRT